MSALAQQPPPVDAAEIFNNAVRAIFSRWTLLRLAVDQGWADGDEAQKADALVTRILADLWAAVALAADKYPERAYGLVHRLVVEQLNARQVTLLFSVVLVAHHPPTSTMIQTLRALYAQLYHQQEAAQQQGGTATRQRLASKLQGMWLLEALR